MLAAARIALAGRKRDTATAEEAVPIRMRACAGEPLYVRAGSSDLVNAISYYANGSQLPPPGVSDPRTVVELGSNCGVALTALASNQPAANLLGVEPDAGNVAIARRNLARFGDRARIVQGAIWDRSEQLTVDPSNPSGEHGVAVRATRPDDPAAWGRLQGITIDELLAENLDVEIEIDYLHVSIEGAEQRVFAAGGSWVERVRSLRVELHPYFGYTADICVPQLEGLGFRAHEGDHPPHTWVFGYRRD